MLDRFCIESSITKGISGAVIAGGSRTKTTGHYMYHSTCMESLDLRCGMHTYVYENCYSSDVRRERKRSDAYLDSSTDYRYTTTCILCRSFLILCGCGCCCSRTRWTRSFEGCTTTWPCCSTSCPSSSWGSPKTSWTSSPLRRASAGNACQPRRRSRCSRRACCR